MIDIPAKYDYYIAHGETLRDIERANEAIREVHRRGDLLAKSVGAEAPVYLPSIKGFIFHMNEVDDGWVKAGEIPVLNKDSEMVGRPYFAPRPNNNKRRMLAVEMRKLNISPLFHMNKLFLQNSVVVGKILSGRVQNVMLEVIQHGDYSILKVPTPLKRDFSGHDFGSRFIPPSCTPITHQQYYELVSDGS